MATIYSHYQISSLKERTIFFDANILIYLFWPTGSHFEQKYARIFNVILKQGNTMALNFTVVSEVVNRIIRIEYNKYIQSNSIDNKFKFKDFRDSKNGEDALSDIYTILKENVLSKFEVIDKAFGKTEIINLLKTETLDFSDKQIAVICRENHLILLTNDKDYKNTDLEILTL